MHYTSLKLTPGPGFDLDVHREPSPPSIEERKAMRRKWPYLVESEGDSEQSSKIK